MSWVKTDFLDDKQSASVRAFLTSHPILSHYAGSTCAVLTGSYAFGLGGPGADVDLKVICPGALFGEIRSLLIADGRFGPADEPGEDITGVVGDYVLESIDSAWESVRDYHDLAQVFICAHLIPLSGQTSLVRQLVEHCRQLPEPVVERAIAGEKAALDQNVYAFLRSFQTDDPIGRCLARANILRAAMRLAFLAEHQAPPYDKHLAKLLPKVARGRELAELAATYFGGEPCADELAAYAGVAAAPDWREMYAAARQTPVMRFVGGVRGLLLNA